MSLTEGNINLLEALLREQVSFTVVGGHAVSFYGHSRVVPDLDLLVLPSENNAIRISAALKEFGFKIEGPYLRRMAMPDANCILPGHLNCQLLGHIQGVEVASAIEHSVRCRVGHLDILVLCLAHLRTNKRTCGRPKDLEDLARLECQGQFLPARYSPT